MEQLLQLQQLEAEFTRLDAVVLLVFREEQFGLPEIRKRLRADFVLGRDLEAQQTDAYGVGPPLFNTFFLDRQGAIQAVLSGETYERPSGQEILAQLRAVSGEP